MLAKGRPSRQTDDAHVSPAHVSPHVYSDIGMHHFAAGEVAELFLHASGPNGNRHRDTSGHQYTAFRLILSTERSFSCTSNGREKRSDDYKAVLCLSSTSAIG